MEWWRDRKSAVDGARPRVCGQGAVERGVGLVDVTVAMVIMLAALIPVLEYFTTSETVAANASAQRLAAGILDGQVSQAQQSTFPGTWNMALTAATWPTAPTSTVTQDGTLFDVYAVGGWCVLTGTAWGDGTVPASVPPTYHVLVKVTWGKTSSAAHAVEDSTEMTSANVTGEPAVGTLVNSCPLELA